MTEQREHHTRHTKDMALWLRARHGADTAAKILQRQGYNITDQHIRRWCRQTPERWTVMQDHPSQLPDALKALKRLDEPPASTVGDIGPWPFDTTTR